MTTALAMPHFINYPGQIPGALPPVSVPVSQYNGNHPVSTANGSNNYGTVPTVQVPMVPVGGGCYNDGMEVVWHGEFSRLFSNFFPPHVWYLTITNQAPQQKWKFHRDSAKVRFCCQDCGNGWTSMKGRVTFWFHLDYEHNAGFVQFKLYGQQCKKCNSGKFEYVMWYPEEVSKVMCNVYHKVGQTYYGFLQPPIRIDRRPGRPRNQHNADLCQACRDGECDQARPIKPLFNVSNGLATTPLPIAVAPASNASPVSPATTPGSTQLFQFETIATSQPVATPATSSEATSKAITSPSTSNISYITSPVTIAPGVQPMLTYSVVGAPPKSTPLTVPSNQFLAHNTGLPPVNGHYIYHPTPTHIVGGAIPIHPSAVYPILPPKQLIRSELKPQVQAATITALSNEMEAATITDELDLDKQNKSAGLYAPPISKLSCKVEDAQ